MKSAEKKEEFNNNNENLEINGIKKNLGALFNQHAGKQINILKNQLLNLFYY